MNETALIDWAKTVPKHIPDFLEQMRTDIPGHFKHSYSCDRLKPASNWGLIQTILVVKILAVLNDEKLWERFDKDDFASVILSFEKPNGLIIDPIVNRQGYLNRIKRAIRKLTLKGLCYNNEAVAMTRMSYNALLLLGHKPLHNYSTIEYTLDKVRKFVHNLPWENPWAAGSHFNHLLFFLNIHRKMFGLDENLYKECVGVALETLNDYFDRKTGQWLLLKTTNQNTAVNGMMKICMALRIIDRLDYIGIPEKLIDHCLEITTGKSGCDFFNHLYVMHSMMILTDYKKEEVQATCLRILETIKEHYYEKEKGFSMFKNKAEEHFYGYRFCTGKPEPDLHGTTMYVWALALINDVCGLGMTILTPIT